MVEENSGVKGKKMSVFGQQLLSDVDIFIDVREHSKHPYFKKFLQEKELTVSIVKLEEGDFLIPQKNTKPAIIIERKTVNDFLSSIIDNRLWVQSERLAEISKKYRVKPYLLLEGNIEETLRKRNIHSNAFSRAIEILQERYHIYIIYSINWKTTLDWISLKAKQQKEKSNTKEKKVIAYQKKPSKLTVNEKILYALSTITGRETALKLLKKYGSIKNIANLSLQQLMEIEGIGEKRAREIFILFNKKWEEIGE